jgi:A/G-specific adenine glycosylase
MTREIAAFQEEVWEYYAKHGRDLPWRVPEIDGTYDPYKILVSEIMLQQTQVNRVITKYQSFLAKFPNVSALAQTPLAAVLAEWSGLGYNRRAKFLHEAAKQLVTSSEPWKLEDLMCCKGIGPNTAAAIMTYTYAQPFTFIETNIRTVFIHHFFHDQVGVADKELISVVEQAIDKEHPREWYWALMDYGVHIKATVGNLSRLSKHYAKQTTFVGSKRQVRGKVLRLLKSGNISMPEMAASIADDRLDVVLADLVKEGLITETTGTFRLG